MRTDPKEILQELMKLPKIEVEYDMYEYELQCEPVTVLHAHPPGVYDDENQRQLQEDLQKREDLLEELLFALKLEG